MATLTTLTKDKYIPFLDTTQSMDYSDCEWAAIDLSTVFELAMNEETEEYDYICYAAPVTEVESNKPSMDQEIRTVEGNKVHDFIAKQFYDMPIGDQCKTPFLLCFGGEGKKAWRGTCTLTNKTLNTVDKKYTFTMEMGGDIEKGTYAIASGVPTFTPAKGAGQSIKEY